MSREREALVLADLPAKFSLAKLGAGNTVLTAGTTQGIRVHRAFDGQGRSVA